MIIANHREQKTTAKNILLVTVALGFSLLFSTLLPPIVSADWSLPMSTNGGDYYKGYQKIELFIPAAYTGTITWASAEGANNFYIDGSPVWSATTINRTITPNYALLVGNQKTTGTLYWDALFTGDAPDEFSIDVLIYKNATSNPNSAYGVQYLFTRSGTVWTLTGSTPLDKSTYSKYNREVPVPPTVFLLGTGLIGMAVLRKRVHKKDNTP